MKYTATITLDYTPEDSEALFQLGQDVTGHFEKPNTESLTRSSYEKFIETAEIEENIHDAVSEVVGIENVYLTLIKS